MWLGQVSELFELQCPQLYRRDNNTYLISLFWCLNERKLCSKRRYRLTHTKNVLNLFLLIRREYLNCCQLGGPMCVTVKAGPAWREPRPGACPPQGQGCSCCSMCPLHPAEIRTLRTSAACTCHLAGWMKEGSFCLLIRWRAEKNCRMPTAFLGATNLDPNFTKPEDAALQKAWEGFFCAWEES